MSASLLHAWRRTVRAAPDAIALIDPAAGGAFTRRQLDLLGDRWALEHGAGLAAQPVAMCEPNGGDWWRVFLGLLKADAVIVPLDAGEPPAAQAALAATAGAARLWSAKGWRPATLGRKPARDGRRLVKLTSGSTGLPRALPFTDAQMMADGRQICRGMGITGRDLNLGIIPFGHSYGMGNLVLPLVLQGTGVVCEASPLPQAIARAVERWRPSVFPAVPAILRALVEAEVAPDQLAPLRLVISAGSPLAREVAQAFYERFARRVHNFYGSSETGGISYDPAGEAATSDGNVGLPLPGVYLSWEPAGRFSVSSRAVLTLGNRRRGRAGVGAHRPADRARRKPNGEILLLGRAGRMVKIAGRRLDLSEVERALRNTVGVKDAFVAPEPNRPDALVAIVATSLSGGQLRRDLQTRLASWKVPKRFLVLAQFPLTARGKTDTGRLRQLLAGAAV